MSQQTNSFNVLSLLVTENMYLWVIWKIELMLNKNAEEVIILLYILDQLAGLQGEGISVDSL